MKKIALCLFCATSLFAQEGQNVKGLFGAGPPNANLAHVVGTQYIDTTTNVLYFCSAVTLTATVSSCTWTAGGGVSPNSPIPQAQVGPGFNVKNYGALGDWQSSNNGATTTSNTQTCSDCNFTQADVGKTICGATLSTTELPCTTIDIVNSTTSVHTVGAATNTFNPQTFAWGTNNDAAITSVRIAAAAASKTKTIVGNLGVMNSTPRVYLPAGGYGVCTSNLYFTFTGDGIAVIGDGPEQTVVYALTGCTYGAASGVLGFASGTAYGNIQGLTLDGMNGNNNSTSGFLLAGSHLKSSDVVVQRFSGVPYNLSGAQIDNDNVVVVSNNPGGGGGIACTACQAEFHNSTTSNNGAGNANARNLEIVNVVGANTSPGFRWWGGLIDECGSQANGCTQIRNSHDVWLNGGGFFGTNSGQAINVDGTSFVHISGGMLGSFGNDTNNSGLFVQTGGIVQASDVRFMGTGTGKCINNNGSLNDNGGNSCESQFVIASGTSTGTTAVLTVTTLGANANTNCTVGDALEVQGAAIAGYNGYYPAGATSGITAVTATTITYTTAGSNLGALSGGGIVSCRNLQSYSGTLPRALLNNPIPNTCYVTITPIVNATTYTLCNWRAQNATNITRIMASSQNVTACATAPIITISDGTATQTLTLTTAKQSWDSAVDTSTGVGTTIFKPNGTITVKYDVAAASACATPPTQLAVSYNISPILSN